MSFRASSTGFLLGSSLPISCSVFSEYSWGHWWGASRIRTHGSHRHPPACNISNVTVDSIIMLAGIYYGAMYGGSTTSVLVNIPGEAASVVTVPGRSRDGKERAGGAALGVAGVRVLHRRDIGTHWTHAFCCTSFTIRIAIWPP